MFVMFGVLTSVVFLSYKSPLGNLNHFHACNCCFILMTTNYLLPNPDIPLEYQIKIWICLLYFSDCPIVFSSSAYSKAYLSHPHMTTSDILYFRYYLSTKFIKLFTKSPSSSSTIHNLVLNHSWRFCLICIPWI